MPEYKASELIGATGSVTRRIDIVDAKQAADGTIQIRVEDSMGNAYWTELDGDISID
ncbi:hypothetical protein HW560_15650 [Paenibacillus sp. E222]|uniref:hypothetical protein n=1 Tax=Paenibacillus sp. E222 TaxID=2748863 RepID=UPI0015C59B66|nr:hypothetical protein [Paenibacillus sp. E222]QLG39383.1 hypothetical protein HW560_15650 [Paenibacillus sp. E222]